MAYGIGLVFAPRTEAQMRRVWSGLERQGFTTPLVRPGCLPHVSLILSEALRVEGLVMHRVYRISFSQEGLAWGKAVTRDQSCGAFGGRTVDVSTIGHVRIGLTSIMSGAGNGLTVVVAALEVELRGRGCKSLTDAPL
jgi:hypothetical protein